MAELDVERKYFMDKMKLRAPGRELPSKSKMLEGTLKKVRNDRDCCMSREESVSWIDKGMAASNIPKRENQYVIDTMDVCCFLLILLSLGSYLFQYCTER